LRYKSHSDAGLSGYIWVVSLKKACYKTDFKQQINTCKSIIKAAAGTFFAAALSIKHYYFSDIVFAPTA